MMLESEKPPRGEHLRYLLTAYVFESISEAGRREVEEHLAACAECRAELEELRGTVASVEDAFAGEAGGAAGYSFEARRLERVLAAGRTRAGASGWLARWRSFRVAAAAMIAIGIGCLLLLPMLMRGRMAAPGARYELARRSDGVYKVGGSAVEFFDASADGVTVILGANDQPVTTLRTSSEQKPPEVAFYVKDVEGGAATAAAPGEPAALPAHGTTTWAAPQAKPPEVASEFPGRPGGGGGGRVAVDGGRVAVDGITSGADGRREGRPGPGAGAAGAGAALGGPAVPVAPPPAARPEGQSPDRLRQLSDLARGPQPLGVGGVQIQEQHFGAEVNEHVRDFGVVAGGKPGADRWGVRVGKPVDPPAKFWNAAKPNAAEDGFVSTSDDVAVLMGGGDDYDHFGGESTSPSSIALKAKQEGAAANESRARLYSESRQVAMEHGFQEREVAQVPGKETGRFHRGDVKLDGAEEGKATDAYDLAYREKSEDETQARKLAEELAESPPDHTTFYNSQLGRDLKRTPAELSDDSKESLEATIAGASEAAQQRDSMRLDDAKVEEESRRKSVKELQKTPAPAEPPQAAEMATVESQFLDIHEDFLAEIGGDFEHDAQGGTGFTVQDSSELSKGQAVQGWGYAARARRAPAKPGLPPPDPSALEGLLRNYFHYKRLDQGLALDEFSSRSLEIPAPIVGDEGLGQEGFRKRHGVNPFVDTRRDHFSTFGMDVDTASYTLARGALAAGRLPDPRHIRVEEFVNYFPDDVPASKDRVFSVRGEGGPSPFGEGLDLVKLTVKARDLHPGERKDAVLTFAVDTSGSMHEGDRLALVREALATLVRSLNPDDRVAVVGFSDHPYLVLPHTPAREADRILGAVASLAPRGDTNFEAGLALAYRVADEVLEPKAVHRVILCSDGVATAGARGAEEILERVEVFAKRGIYLSCIGFGMGKYNDRLLETLADRGNGNYAYADDLKAAAEVFRKNLPATLQVLAQDAKVQVDFDPEVVSHYRLVGYENRDIADRDFRNDKVDAGEVGPGTTVTVLYEVLRRPGSSGDIGRVHVRYRDTGTGRVVEESTPLPPGVVATRLEETSDRFRFIACAAETAELLRGSYWARNGSYGRVLGVLRGLGAEMRSRPEWGELAGLAARAQALTIRTLHASFKSTDP